MIITRIYCLLYTIVMISGTKLIWKHSVNYKDSKFWSKEQLPDNNSHIVFSKDLNGVVTLPNETTTMNVILPSDGGILMPKDSKLVIKFDQNPLTSETEFKVFSRVPNEDWSNPLNWEYDEMVFENVAKPDVENIPCRYDDVEFPYNSIFSVQMPSVPVILNSVRINDVQYNDTETFKQIMSLKATFGLHAKSGDDLDIIQVIPKNCTDKSSCVCHEGMTEQEYNILEEDVCAHINRTCGIPLCIEPILPKGHCCSLCGAYLLYDFLSDFDFDTFDNEYLYEIILKYNPFHNEYHASKVLIDGHPYIQVIFVDLYGFDGISKKLADLLIERLENDLQVGLKLIVYKESGYYYNPNSKINGPVPIIFGTLLLVIIFMILVVVIFYPLKGHKFPNIQWSNSETFQNSLFARYENTVDDGDLEFGEHSNVQSNRSHRKREFNNPLYVDTAEEATTIEETINLISTPATLDLGQNNTEQVQEIEDANLNDSDIVSTDLL